MDREWLAGDEGRLKVAYHEAGHAVAAQLLRGRIVGPVSIRPTKRWSGVAYVRAPRFSPRDVETVDLAFPIATYPVGLRRALELDAIICLAGPAAEALRPDQSPVRGYRPEPASRLDDRLAAGAVAALTSGEARMLARGNEDETDPRPHDEQRALDATLALVGYERAGALLEFLRVETKVFVCSYSFQRRLHPLAAALVERTDLSARFVRGLLRQVGDSVSATSRSTAR